VLSAVDRLSSREIEVLRCIGNGMSRVEIGKSLSRSPKTIDGHQERIMRKLGIETRNELMRWAIREGIANA
jgi:DNA-binding CsgD family transcriptional regulator